MLHDPTNMEGSSLGAAGSGLLLPQDFSIRSLGFRVPRPNPPPSAAASAPAVSNDKDPSRHGATIGLLSPQEIAEFYDALFPPAWLLDLTDPQHDEAKAAVVAAVGVQPRAALPTLWGMFLKTVNEKLIRPSLVMVVDRCSTTEVEINRVPLGHNEALHLTGCNDAGDKKKGICSLCDPHISDLQRDGLSNTIDLPTTHVLPCGRYRGSADMEMVMVPGDVISATDIKELNIIQEFASSSSSSSLAAPRVWVDRHCSRLDMKPVYDENADMAVGDIVCNRLSDDYTTKGPEDDTILADAVVLGVLQQSTDIETLGTCRVLWVEQPSSVCRQVDEISEHAPSGKWTIQEYLTRMAAASVVTSATTSATTDTGGSSTSMTDELYVIAGQHFPRVSPHPLIFGEVLSVEPDSRLWVRWIRFTRTAPATAAPSTGDPTAMMDHLRLELFHQLMYRCEVSILRSKEPDEGEDDETDGGGGSDVSSETRAQIAMVGPHLGTTMPQTEEPPASGDEEVEAVEEKEAGASTALSPPRGGLMGGAKKLMQHIASWGLGWRKPPSVPSPPASSDEAEGNILPPPPTTQIDVPASSYGDEEPPAATPAPTHAPSATPPPSSARPLSPTAAPPVPSPSYPSGDGDEVTTAVDLPTSTTSVNATGSDDVLPRFAAVGTFHAHRFLDQPFTPSNPQRFVQRVRSEWNSLKKELLQPLVAAAPSGSPSTSSAPTLNSVYVKVAEESGLHLLKFVLIGAIHTPYYQQFLPFDVVLPPEYPIRPPVVHCHTLGFRFNPNLYEDGHICLSLLGTWEGHAQCEQWNPALSTLLQVIVSIQGLLLVKEPYYNEAGFDAFVGTARGRQQSRQYNEMAYVLKLRHMIELAGGLMSTTASPPPPSTPSASAASPPTVNRTPDWVFEFRSHYRLVVPSILRRAKQYLAGGGTAAPSTDSSTEGEGRMNADGLVLPLSPGLLASLQTYVPALERQHVQCTARWDREEAMFF